MTNIKKQFLNKTVLFFELMFEYQILLEPIHWMNRVGPYFLIMSRSKRIYLTNLMLLSTM